MFNKGPSDEGLLGSRGTALGFLYVGTRCKWVVKFPPQLLYQQRNGSRYLLGRRLCAHQRRSRPSARSRTPTCRPVKLVTWPL